MTVEIRARYIVAKLSKPAVEDASRNKNKKKKTKTKKKGNAGFPLKHGRKKFPGRVSEGKRRQPEVVSISRAARLAANFRRRIVSRTNLPLFVRIHESILQRRKSAVRRSARVSQLALSAAFPPLAKRNAALW